MTKLRRATNRGHTQTDWLDSRHTFSFGGYHDPRHQGFGSLRVINDNRLQANSGFAPHSHQERDILTWVIEGTLEHRDDAGHHSIIRPGDIQRLTTGTGITHSEHNAAPQTTRFIQIWLYPERRGLAPEYALAHFDDNALRNRWCLIASRDGRDGSVSVHQYVDMLATRASAGTALNYPLPSGHMAWLQVVNGAIEINGRRQLGEGDSASWTNPVEIQLTVKEDAEVLLFDLSS